MQKTTENLSRVISAEKVIIDANCQDDFFDKSDKKTDAQKWFSDARTRMVSANPMTMEAIDRIIHEKGETT